MHKKNGEIDKRNASTTKANPYNTRHLERYSLFFLIELALLKAARER
jgi:hypothetical protein